MSNDTGHFEFLQQCMANGQLGINKWNEWRKENPSIQPYFGGENGENSRYLADAKLSGIDLNGAIFVHAFMLSGVQLDGANLEGATIQGAIAINSNFSGANLTNAQLNGSRFDGVDFNWANLTGADFSEARLTAARFYGAALDKTNFENADLTRADLSNANLTGLNFCYAQLAEANLTNAIISECKVYGVSAWNMKTSGSTQKDLIVTNYNESVITVDNIEVAQFIHLLLNNPKIRDVIDTVASKAVLILGRFTNERKAVLYKIKEELRRMGYLPILFDFNNPSSQDTTETVQTLANLSRFIIADLTDQNSVPHELSVITSGQCKKPIQAIYQPSIDQIREYSMFADLRAYPWVLPLYQYDNIQHLTSSLEEKVISPVENYLASKK